MPTNTYVALATHTVPSNVASYTFTSVPQGYTDLILVINGKHSANQNEDYGLRFNSDTGSNYSSTYLLGSGTAALSGRVSNQTKTISGWLNATDIGTYIDHIQNYSNTTTYKTVISRGAQTDSDTYLSANVSLWRNTAAITSITVVPAAASLASGMTLSLYGIKAWAPEVTPKATGGYVYQDSSYWYHAFLSSGTFTPNQSLTCDYLVVAGGAGGSYDVGGAGGAGGLRSTVGTTGGGGSLESALSLSATDYTVTVGAGGAGALTGSRIGGNGSNSVFSTITSTGGGGGGQNGGNGASGGSGGGGSRSGGNGGAGTTGQGYSGGNGTGGTTGAGGGGGAGSAGTSASTGGGAGGNGVQITALATPTLTGISGYYAGGGGGGGNTVPPAPGGLGGGGQGGTPGGLNITPGIANTGGGGGGCGGGDSAGNASGGSGIVIVRYAK